VSGSIIKPVVSPEEAVKSIRDGNSVMVGGFNYGGIPYTVIEALLDSGVKDLVLISNDTAYDDVGHGKLVTAGRVRKVIGSHIGLNKTTQKLFHDGKLELEITPQGTFVERIRAGGFGLGGVLTPTGVGTAAAEGKRTIKIDGKAYLLELPLRADFALIRGYKADRCGNLVYFGTNRNFNPIMATAAETVIAEVDSVEEAGAFDPDTLRFATTLS